MPKTKKIITAAQLHEDVPPDWYYKSIYIDKNLLQRFVHGSRFREVAKLIEPTGGTVLDIGSADGVFTNVVLKKSKAKKIIGIDVLKDSVVWASGHWKKNKKMSFRVADAHKLPFKAGTFDAVVALEVLEHVFNPTKVVGEIKRVLKKDGYAVMLVPAESTLFRIVWFFWTKNKGSIWAKTHIHHYKSGRLLPVVKKAGLAIEVNKKIIFGTLHLVKARKV